MREIPDPGCENDQRVAHPGPGARAARLTAQIAELTQAGFILPGTLTERDDPLRHTPAAGATPTRPSCTAPTTSGPGK